MRATLLRMPQHPRSLSRLYLPDSIPRRYSLAPLPLRRMARIDHARVRRRRGANLSTFIGNREPHSGFRFDLLPEKGNPTKGLPPKCEPRSDGSSRRGNHTGLHSEMKTSQDRTTGAREPPRRRRHLLIAEAQPARRICIPRARLG
jgi:hypothetical protein